MPEGVSTVDNYVASGTMCILRVFSRVETNSLMRISKEGTGRFL